MSCLLRRSRPLLRLCPCVFNIPIVDKQYQNDKIQTKAALDASHAALADCDPDIRAQYEEIQRKRAEYKAAVELAKKEGRDEPEPPEDMDQRTAEDLQTALDNEEAKLELNSNNNPGVVEQYEARRRQVSLRSVALTDGVLMDMRRSRC